MIAGAPVPQELLQLVKKSLLTSSASPFYNIRHYPPHFQPAACESKIQTNIDFFSADFSILFNLVWFDSVIDFENNSGASRVLGKRGNGSRAREV